MDLGMRADVRSPNSAYSVLSTTDTPIHSPSTSSGTLPISKTLNDTFGETTPGFRHEFTQWQVPYLHASRGSDCSSVGLNTVSPTPSVMYTNLGTHGDEPRSVAVCPDRKCVAFGCRTGIELHWVDMLTGSSLNRWFPIATPSDYLYFLPQRSHVDPTRKLRLMSSAARAYTETHDSEEKRMKRTSMSSRQGQSHVRSMTRLFFDRLPSSSARVNDGDRQDERARYGVIHTVECDHYQAIPLSDGVHILFIDPTTGLLCLGTDAPIGAPVKLMRKACMTPPSAGPQGFVTPISCYKAAHELRWGVRIVAAYEDGGVVLYNISSECFERIRYIKSSPRSWISPDNKLGFGVSESLSTTDVSIVEHRHPVDSRYSSPHGDLLQSSVSTPQQAYVACLQIEGQEIYRSKAPVADIQVNCTGGGVKVWLFTRDGRAIQLDIYAPRGHTTKMGYADVDGVIHTVQEHKDDRRARKRAHEAEDTDDSDGSRLVKFRL